MDKRTIIYLDDAIDAAVKGADEYYKDSIVEELMNVPPVHPEPCEDTISRKAAIDAVKHAWAKGLEPIQYIEDLPSAQPKHDISKANFLCPICGAEMEVSVSEWEEKDE